MKITCDQAAVICNKSQYKEASWFEILKLKLHHLYCSVCAQHSSKNAKLTNLCQKARLQALSEDEKMMLKQNLKKQR